MSKMTLFANCIPVRGATRSIICDLQRTTYEIIPSSMCEFLTYYSGKTLEEIKKDFSKEDQMIIDDYVNYLVDKEYVFFSDHPENFPPLNLEWDSPSMITNAIIDFDLASNHDFKKIIDQLTVLRCQALELRFFDVYPISFIKQLIEQTKNSSLRYVSLVIKYDAILNDINLKELLSANSVLTHILIHNCPYNVLSELENSVFYTTDELSDETHCGVISEFNFSVNITSFTESLHFNSCLNRKVSVDKRGEVKNCPSLAVSFGNINSVNLCDIVQQAEFKKTWTIKKDLIEVCKDCEFRYICTDCRAYVADPFAKPLKCSYDPYHPEESNFYNSLL
ncbi:grasp-with-spasm system SPASM domain peptide maturase [Mucilaginibacter sp. CSA2-8R]|uniref:grasp-with-spasm system SPASM domain peptide maturase n=1 Tax=Mucilaginibacter sp. CSA2-8R TaxID=3141542 RepID=UPI00315D6992